MVGQGDHSGPLLNCLIWPGYRGKPVPLLIQRGGGVTRRPSVRPVPAGATDAGTELEPSTAARRPELLLRPGQGAAQRILSRRRTSPASGPNAFRPSAPR